MKKLTGFGLVEVLIAAALIATTIGALFAVSAMAIRLTVLGQDRLIASQIARDGVEVARQIRDTNFVSDVCNKPTQTETCANWWSGLIAPGESGVFGIIQDSERGFTLSAKESGQCGDTVKRTVARTKKTITQVYCRRIFIEPVADLPATSVDESKEMVRVRSQVAWTGSGRNKLRTITVGNTNQCVDPRDSHSTEWCTEQVTLLSNWRPQL